MKRNFYFSLLMMLVFGFAQVVFAQSFNVNYSSEGDIQAKGILTMELTQTKSKIEGVANYKSSDGQIDTGMFSVNGYAKNKVGFIRFRDQRGNVVADGTIKFKDPQTLEFKQTTSSNQLPKSAFLYNPNYDFSKPVQQTKHSPFSVSYAGKYSNEGDATAKGMLSFDLLQSGAKVEGTATYNRYSDGSQSGLLSVNGYVKDGIAYIRFRDQRGNTVADGALHYEGKNVVFRQTTLSDFVPHYATMYK